MTKQELVLIFNSLDEINEYIDDGDTRMARQTGAWLEGYLKSKLEALNE